MEVLFIQSQAWGLMFLDLRFLVKVLEKKPTPEEKSPSISPFVPSNPLPSRVFFEKPSTTIPYWPTHLPCINKSGFSHNWPTASWSTNKNSLISSSSSLKRHNTSIVFVSGNCGSPVSPKKKTHTRCSGGQVLSICLVFDQNNTTELGKWRKNVIIPFSRLQVG